MKSAKAPGAAAANGDQAWWVTAAVGAGVIAVTYGFARYAYGLFVPDFREAFALSTTGLGVLGGLSTLGYAVGLMAAPALAVRASRATALAAGAVAFLGLALMTIAPGVVIFGAGTALAGSSAGLSSPSLSQLVGQHVGRQQQNQAQTWTNTGTSIGLALSAFTPLLAFGWRGAWAIFACVALLATITAAMKLPGSGLGKTGTGPSLRIRRPELSLAPTTARLLVVSALLGLTSAPYWNFSRERVLQLDMSPFVSTVFWFTIGAAGLLGGLAGYLVDRRGLARANGIAWSGWTIALGMLGLPNVGPVPAFISAALFGAAYMALTGLCILWSARLFPTAGSRGVTYSFAALAVGQTLGAPMAGMIAETAGISTAFGSSALVSLVALVLASRGTPTPPIPSGRKVATTSSSAV